MTKPLEIPQDIIDNVIAAVGNDRRVLKQCALVSSSFLLPSRKLLFSRITLRSDQTSQRIHQFLVQNPVIQSFVRSITLTEHNPTSQSPEWMNGKSLLAILRLQFCCLECFSISSMSYWNLNLNWNSFSSELKDALSNIIHSSTLKTLSLKSITKLPNTFFQHIVHITTLELHSISPIDFCDESSLTQAASKGVVPIASQTVIDQCSWSFVLPRYGIPFICLFFTNSRDRRANTTELIFLPFMCRIRLLEIYYLDSDPARNALGDDFYLFSFVIRSLFTSLISPATLEHLQLNIDFSGVDDSSTLCDNLRDADLWRHLDSIATHPTDSRFQRVDISIEYTYYDDVDEPDVDIKVKKAVLDGLPLLRMKGILFVKAVGHRV
jgi:hypothetical protein